MKTDEQLDLASSKLSRELQPQRDLWPELAERLPARKAPQRRATVQWATMAASVLLGILVWQADLLPGASLRTDAPAQMQSADVWPVVESVTRELAQTFETEKRRRLEEIEFVSEDFGNWQLQLAVWDSAIGQVQLAIYEEPEDPMLLWQMESLYRQQLDYLQLIASADY